MTDFHTGLFDCFSDMSVCCMGWYCPCILSCQNQEKLEGYKTMRHCCMPMSEFYIRQVIRQRQNYSHAGISDCYAYSCCYACFVCQDARELNKGYGLPLKGEGYKGHIGKSSGKKHKDKDKQNKDQSAPAQQPVGQQPIQQPPPYYPDPQYTQPGYPNYSNAPQYPNGYAPQPAYQVPQGYSAYPPQQNGIPPVQPNEHHHKKDDSSSSSSSS